MRAGTQLGCASSGLASTSSRITLWGCGPSAGRLKTLQDSISSRRCGRGALQVVAVKGAGKKRQQSMANQGAQRPPTPPIDTENVEFVIFIRAVKFPQWFPLSIVKAGSAANALVRGLDTEWGKKLYGKTLVRNIAKSVYADKRNIEKSFRAQAPMMQKFTDFDYAFKIRDKRTPQDWIQAENLTILPKQEDLGGNFLESLRERFSRK